MTLKLKKELAQQTRSRGDGGSAEVQPEAQAAQQIEDSAVNLVGGVRERVTDGVSKAVRRGRQNKTEQRQARKRPEAPTGGTPPPAERTPQSTAPPARDRMRRQATNDLRTRPTEDTQTPPTPKERQTPETPRQNERPEPSVPARKTDTAAPPPKERMRQTAIKNKQTQGTEIRQKLDTPRERTPAPDAKPDRPTIREHPRRTAAPKEKPAGGAFQPKTREAAQTAGKPATRTGPAPIRTPQAPPATAKRPTNKAPAAIKAAGRQLVMERGRKKAQREAQRHVLQQSKKAAQAAAEAGKKLVVATVKAVEGMITALAGLLGGGTLVAILCVLGLIAAIIASPFGILFSNAPSPGAVPLNTAVARIRMELNSMLDALQEGEYDGIDITGHPPDWREVVAVFAAKTSTAKDGVDVAALTPDRVNRLRAVFWDMCIVTSEVETVDYPDSNPDDEIDDSYSETYLHITITAKTAEDMRTAYSFTEKQNEALDELLIELPVMDALLEDLAVSEEQARALVRSLPADLAPERRAVVEAACQLVGKVTYFWGGKSLVLGWDDRWGTLQKVWAAGSVTTGTYRAYGLDCSGFVDWAFYNASNGAYYPGHGGGTYTQHSHCAPVTWAEAQPGDLVFTADVGHVGIVGGRDEAGNLLIIHCYDNVGITGAGEFAIVGRPDYFTE